ncbi:MAG: HAMP domain-containing protein [Cytophagales bacterium]|nr:MAG: HAMP domain-containing protein [Cytophagales bacterium]
MKKYFQNLKITTKLIVSFSIILFLGVSVNIYSNISLYFIKGNTNNISNILIPSLKSITEIRLLISNYRSLQMNHASTNDSNKMADLDLEMKRIDETVRKEKENYERIIQDGKWAIKISKLDSIYAVFKHSWILYLQESQQFSDYSRKYDKNKSLEILDNMYIKYATITEAIVELEILHKKAFEKAVIEEETYYTNNVIANLVLIFIPILVAIPIIYFLVFLIREPIVKLKKAAEDISHGKDVNKVFINSIDEVGVLAKVFNKMLLDIRGKEQKIKESSQIVEWRSELNEIMQMADSLQKFSQEVLNYVTEKTGSVAGALYLKEKDSYRLKSTYPHSLAKHIRQDFELGEGLVGQVALEKTEKRFFKDAGVRFQVSHAFGEEIPSKIWVFPIIESKYKEVLAVIELGKIEHFKGIHETFIELIQSPLGIAFQSILRKEEINSQSLTLIKINEELEEKHLALEQQNEEIQTQKEEIEHQHKKLEEQNKLLDESIKRAEFIQKAILRPESEIQKELEIPMFIFLEPHSKVSGDFYWCKEVNKKKIIIAADCTGHGIPGAMISMIGYDILNQIINLHNITQVDKILSILDEEIIKVFHQDDINDKEANHDGMDISICIYDAENDILEYGGAKNGLIYIQDNILQEIKACKVGIGGSFRDKKIFESHRIELKGKDTMIYLSSDGYQDQFGGKENKKFMRSQLKKLFLQLNNLPLDEQKRRIKEEFYDWKSGQFQTDDVLVMGFRLNARS